MKDLLEYADEALDNLDKVREFVSKALDEAENADAGEDIVSLINTHASLFVKCNVALEDIRCAIEEYRDPGQ